MSKAPLGMPCGTALPGLHSKLPFRLRLLRLELLVLRLKLENKFLKFRKAFLRVLATLPFFEELTVEEPVADFEDEAHGGYVADTIPSVSEKGGRR